MSNSSYIFRILLFVFVLFCLGLCGADEQELFLSPLIKAGELEKARAQAEDNFKSANVKTERDIKSYSGYFTLDDASKSNLFFWFFPAQQNPEKAPLILWINELPGFSSMKGVFTETGPFYVENNVVKERNVTWTRTHSMLYIDAPAGTGFSFAEKEDVADNDVEGDEYYECLQQFFTLFPEYRKLELYFAGENFAASLIPFIVKYIEDQNIKNGDNKMNLKGVIVSSPFLDISTATDRVTDLWNFGLLDETGKEAMLDVVGKGNNLHYKEGKTVEAAQTIFSTYVGPIIEEHIGFNESRSALRTSLHPIQLSFQKFLESKEVHKFLHIGLHKYVEMNLDIFSHFSKEYYQSQIQAFEELLNKGYRVLLVAPQFDIFNTMGGITKTVDRLKWNKSEEYMKSSRKIWRVNGDVAGYVKSVENFAFAVVRNAGNYVLIDQPEWVLDLVERFLSRKEF